MNWSDLARVAADQLDEAVAALTPDSDAATHALVSIAATLYRDVNGPARHLSRPRAVDDDYGIDPPESETERYWREKDEQRT